MPPKLSLNSISQKIFLFLFSLIFLGGVDSIGQGSSDKPNVIVIYLDDLGFGDLSSYGATSISTPNIDKLVHGGRKFTNAYASSATCTPSRFALLTGVYPWRNKNAVILPGTAPLIINKSAQTLPKVFKAAGYETAIIGKWHLGLGTGHVNWNERISPGPNEIGFDYSHILAATQDRVPTVYIEDGTVINLDDSDPILVNYQKNFEGEPTAISHPELLKLKWHHGHNNSIVNGIPRIGFMKGGEDAKWIDEEMADYFLNKFKAYLNERSKTPFFLYYAMQQPHVPRTPHPRFVGKSGMGARGDVILEADWVIGEIIKSLESEGVIENTMIVLSSDNGPVLNDGYYDDSDTKIGDHKPSGGLRGGKYSLFDAGTHVPFITYWQGRIKPGVSDALLCQVDLMKSFSSFLNIELTANQDGENLMDLLLGKSKSGRKSLVLEAISRTSYREGDYVYIPTYKGAKINLQVNIELGTGKDDKLYNLKRDPYQNQDIAFKKPRKLKKLKTGYERIVGSQTKTIAELELK